MISHLPSFFEARGAMAPAQANRGIGKVCGGSRSALGGNTLRGERGGAGGMHLGVRVELVPRRGSHRPEPGERSCARVGGGAARGAHNVAQRPHRYRQRGCLPASSRTPPNKSHETHTDEMPLNLQHTLF